MSSLAKVPASSDFLGFYLLSFSVPGPQPGCKASVLTSPQALLAWDSLLDFSWFLWLGQSGGGGRTGQILLSAPQLGSVWRFSPDSTGVVCLGERDRWGRVWFSWHCSKATSCLRDCSLGVLAEGVLVKFSCEVPLCPSSTSALGKKAAPTSGVGVLLHLLGAGQGSSPLSLAPSAQGVCSPRYSFTQALIYTHADWWIIILVL